VLRHEGCLGRLARDERRVLRLRAGVGIAHPRSRAEVVRITGLRRARVVALERSGMKRLQSLVRTGGCASGPADTTTAQPGGTPAERAGTPAAPPLSATVRHAPRLVVLGARDSKGDREPAAERPSGDSRPFLHGPDSALDLAPVLVAVALAALLFVLIREARRSA
jgi:hypothetical protein